MAGGFKKFGPTYNSTPYIRLGYEGILNGIHAIDPAVGSPDLAGKFAAIGANGVTLAGANNAVGLFREDLADMQNASNLATFYFRGGEYFVYAGGNSANDAARINATGLSVGDEIEVGAGGVAQKFTTGKKVGVVTHIGTYPNGNMFANAGAAANGGTFVGFILYL